tara:strand:+ start:167 stop:865 length:699 start_codon:yes stop_codon:yes gene_type:complete
MSFFINIKKKYKGTVFEVVVIVFGVMLSFLLNEMRLDMAVKDQALSTLRQIKVDLEKDLYDTNINLEIDKSALNAFNTIIESIENRNEYSENLDTLFNRLLSSSFLIPSKTGLQVLNSKGVDFIKNESLRIKYLTLHNYIYQERKMLENISLYNRQMMNQFVSENFNRTYNMYNNYELKPNDYNSLLDDSYFKNILFSCMQGHDYFLRCDSIIKDEILSLIPLLEDEIIKLQ